MRRSGPLVAVVMGALVVAGAVAGCDAPPGTGEPSPQGTAPPVWGALNAYIDDYQEALLQLDRANAIAASDEIAACMKEQGFDYTPDPQGGGWAPPPSPSTSGRTGSPSTATASPTGRAA